MQAQEIKSQEVAVNGHASETNAVLAVIERVALDPNADIAKLEKMLDMQERILNRNAAQAYSAAFARMQAELPEITEKGEIKHSGKLISKYGLLEDINDAVKPVLQKHGFAISFSIKQDNGTIQVTATLRHEEGHSESTSITLPADTSGSKNNVQAIGSAVSYGKRYTMCALLNITTRGEDDDGNATGAIDTEKAAELDLMINETGTQKKAFLAMFGVDDVRHILAKDYDTAKRFLEMKRGAKKNG